MKTEEIHYIANSIDNNIENIERYKREYNYCPISNNFKHKEESYTFNSEWFEL